MKAYQTLKFPLEFTIYSAYGTEVGNLMDQARVSKNEYLSNCLFVLALCLFTPRLFPEFLAMPTLQLP